MEGNIRVKVRYIGGYAQSITGKSFEEVDFSSENVTIKDLLKHLSNKYGERLIYHLYDARNNLRSQTAILLNGCMIDSTKLDMKLSDASEVELAFIPVYAGG
jgi:molybdopterin converting factor small subunit